MIGILLNDNSYEQDIRELLMAFYPGETFAHQEGAEVSFYVEGKVNEARDKFELRIFEKQCATCRTQSAVPGAQSTLIWPDFPPELLPEWSEFLKCAPIQLPYDDRAVSKSKIKRRLYFMLYALTGKLLPWGTLTGIRPAKIAMTKLDHFNNMFIIQNMNP